MKPAIENRGGYKGGPRQLRFIMKVVISEDREACWGWTAGTDKDGYARFLGLPAHRFSYELFTGKCIPKDMLACHKCDNRICCNPRHIFIGTTQDNTADRNAKGRQASGPKIRRTITAAQAHQIHKRVWAGEMQKNLAMEFGISQPMIALIKSGTSWHFKRGHPHVPDYLFDG